jgi:hypothetical protein
VPANLAHLHVTTFNETHAPILMNGPTYEVREYQWRQAFLSPDGSWFCFVIEDPKGELIGFAKGQRYSHHDHPEFAGELNKIYVLREYRRGLGRRLTGCVARRFLGEGISSVLLFGDAQNPSNRFYESLGAVKLFAASGEFSCDESTSRSSLAQVASLRQSARTDRNQETSDSSGCPTISAATRSNVFMAARLPRLGAAVGDHERRWATASAGARAGIVR